MSTEFAQENPILNVKPAENQVAADASFPDKMLDLVRPLDQEQAKAKASEITKALQIPSNYFESPGYEDFVADMVSNLQNEPTSIAISTFKTQEATYQVMFDKENQKVTLTVISAAERAKLNEDPATREAAEKQEKIKQQVKQVLDELGIVFEETPTLPLQEGQVSVRPEGEAERFVKELKIAFTYSSSGTTTNYSNSEYKYQVIQLGDSKYLASKEAIPKVVSKVTT